MSLYKLFKIAVCGLLVFSIPGHSGLAQMSSSNYKIPVDAVDVGGGASGSESFNLLDSVGEVASGSATSESYALNAGFIGAQSVYIAVSSPVDVTMSPSIGGISGGSGNGSSSWNVTTDNAAGYSFNIKSTTAPALRSGSSSFADYGPAGANPDYTWSVAAADGEFGISPEGSDIVQRFRDNGTDCNVGSGDTVDKCWAALSTIDQLVAQRVTGNHPNGISTTVKMRAESGSNHIQPSGTYTTTITITVVPL